MSLVSRGELGTRGHLGAHFHDAGVDAGHGNRVAPAQVDVVVDGKGSRQSDQGAWGAKSLIYTAQDGADRCKQNRP